MVKLITIFSSFYPTESFGSRRPTAAAGLKSFRGEPALVEYILNTFPFIMGK